MNLSNVSQEALFYLLKGEPGTRKSTHALSFADLGRQYWFSWDRKMAGLLLPMRAWGINPKDIDYDDYEDWKTPVKKLEELRVNCPYKGGIIFDSITSMTDMTLRQAIKMKAGVTRGSGAAAGKMVGGIAVNELEDYNAESAALQELVALAKDIKAYHNINVFLIAHVVQAEYRNNTNGETHISRSIVTAAKKAAHKIPAYCDEVYHFNIEKGMVVGQGGKYTCITEHTGDDFARTTLPLGKTLDLEGSKSLYRDYIKPAVLKMSLAPPTVEKF